MYAHEPDILVDLGRFERVAAVNEEHEVAGERIVPAVVPGRRDPCEALVALPAVDRLRDRVRPVAECVLALLLAVLDAEVVHDRCVGDPASTVSDLLRGCRVRGRILLRRHPVHPPAGRALLVDENGESREDREELVPRRGKLAPNPRLFARRRVRLLPEVREDVREEDVHHSRAPAEARADLLLHVVERRVRDAVGPPDEREEPDDLGGVAVEDGVLAEEHPSHPHEVEVLHDGDHVGA